MNEVLWVAIAEGRRILGASTAFDEADKVGKEYAKKHKTTFYLREYVETGIGLPQLLREAAVRLEKEG